MNSQEFLQQYKLGRRDFSGEFFAELRITGHNIENISLRNSSVNLSNLRYVRFFNSDLRGIFFNSANLDVCVFINCDLSKAIFNGSRLTSLSIINSDFSKASLENSFVVNELSIRKSTMYKVNLQKTEALEIYIEDSNLSGVDLTDCNIKKITAIRSNFTYAILKSVKFHRNYNRNSICNNFSFADLRKADLSYIDLQNSNFVGADLREANLSYSNLQRVDMTLARLKKTNLEGANLKGTRGLRFVKVKPSGHSNVKSIRIIEGAFLKNTRLPHGNLIEEAQYCDAENPIGRTNSNQRLN
ncbi:Pentapeptide repeat family protein [Geitlerinema sp. FC II]|nr:Pentapeptide repeat family protein [Geitlerinema sp. FC II]